MNTHDFGTRKQYGVFDACSARPASIEELSFECCFAASWCGHSKAHAFHAPDRKAQG